MTVKTAIRKSHWGDMPMGEVYLFKLINEHGHYVELTNYGATVVNIAVPDKHGKQGEVVLSYPSFGGYLNDRFYMGSTIGRYANRISNGSFELDGARHQLELNDGKNTNHGGFSGHHQKLFAHEVTNDGVKFILADPDGSGGFPGALQLEVTYSWGNDNTLTINYKADTDKPTIANFTDHVYFKLSGNKNNILNDRVSINSGLYLKSTEDHLPSGTIAVDTQGFINGLRLGDVIDAERPIETGLNRYFILLNESSATKPQATLYNDETGRELQVFTSYPGIMLYTGQYLDSPLSGICLECQHYPDSINHDHFPQAILRPGQTYNEFIKYRFNVKLKNGGQ